MDGNDGESAACPPLSTVCSLSVRGSKHLVYWITLMRKIQTRSRLISTEDRDVPAIAIKW
jgi:hypothetical protein